MNVLAAAYDVDDEPLRRVRASQLLVEATPWIAVPDEAE
jgi:hypothetical protein